jgi:hypothetical protein
VLAVIGPDRPPPRRELHGPRVWLWGGALISAIVVAGFAWWWSATAEDRAIRSLPEPERRSLYQRTMANLETICEPAAPRSMRDFCRGQAELATRLPECDGSCQEIAHRHLTLPTR